MDPRQPDSQHVSWILAQLCEAWEQRTGATRSTQTIDEEEADKPGTLGRCQ